MGSANFPAGKGLEYTRSEVCLLFVYILQPKPLRFTLCLSRLLAKESFTVCLGSSLMNTLSDHLHFVPVSNQGVFYTTLSQSPAKEFDTALS